MNRPTRKINSESIILQQHPNEILPFHQDKISNQKPNVDNFLKSYKHLIVIKKLYNKNFID